MSFSVPAQESILYHFSFFGQKVKTANWGGGGREGRGCSCNSTLINRTIKDVMRDLAK